MPINDMTSSAEHEIWYNHHNTVALRKELAQGKEQIFGAWVNGDTISESDNKAMNTAYRVLSNTEEFMLSLSKGVDLNEPEEEDDEDETES